MKNLEDAERQFIEGARRAWSPSAQDAERVLLALDHKMADLGSMAEPSHTATSRGEVGPAPVAEGVTGLSGSLFLSPIPRWVLAAVALSGGAGSLGYALGFRAGARTTAPAVAHVVSAGPAPAQSARPLEAGLREPVASPAPEQPPKVNQAGGDARDEPAPPRGSGSAPEKRASAALDEEVRTLRRVERALREQNPRLALALLDDLDRAVPNGQLGMERFAASTLARCALGYGSRPALLEDFAKRHPASAYLTRIRQECAAKPVEGGEGE
jgi:hypothetical protein